MAINVDYKAAEIGSLPVSTTSLPSLVAGYAVYVNTSGNVDSNILASKRVLGLVKESYIAGVVNELTGGSGIYGAGKATVLAHGIVTVRQSVYNGVSYQVYDQTHEKTVWASLRELRMKIWRNAGNASRGLKTILRSLMDSLQYMEPISSRA